MTLPGGVAVTTGAVLTAAQLGGLLFTPTPGAFSVTSVLGYTVGYPAGNSAAGSATLSIGRVTGNPSLQGGLSVSVPAGTASVPLNIPAPADPNYPLSALTISVAGLPGNGTVTLADGTPLVAAGQVLTAPRNSRGCGSRQERLPLVRARSASPATDPVGNASTATIAISVTAQAGAPTIGLLPSGTSIPVLRVVTDSSALTVTGTAAPGATVTLSGGLGVAVANASGNWSVTLPQLAVRLSRG